MCVFVYVCIASVFCYNKSHWNKMDNFSLKCSFKSISGLIMVRGEKMLLAAKPPGKEWWKKEEKIIKFGDRKFTTDWVCGMRLSDKKYRNRRAPCNMVMLQKRARWSSVEMIFGEEQRCWNEIVRRRVCVETRNEITKTDNPSHDSNKCKCGCSFGRKRKKTNCLAFHNGQMGKNELRKKVSLDWRWKITQQKKKKTTKSWCWAH